jgi:8-oxo-dGTP diphosphatase
VRLVALTCTLVSGEPAALDHAEVRWLAADELDTVTWAPADIPLLGAVKSALA